MGLGQRSGWRQLMVHVRSEDYFHDSSRSGKKLPGPLFCQRLQAADYGLFDVLQGLIHTVTLRVASGECRAAYNVAALFSFLKDNFEIHDLSYDVGS